MSSEANNTRELEAALRYLADNPDRKIEFIAGKFQVEGGKATLWAWLTKFNGGKKELPAHRIDNALRQAAPAEKPAPVAKARIQGALERAAREPKSAAAIADSSPNKSDKWPWIGKRWRGDGFRNWRPALVLLARDPRITLREAAGDDNNRGIALAGFLGNWCGKPPRGADLYKAFLAYGDSQEGGHAPAPEPLKPAPRAPAIALVEVPAAPQSVSKDGWLEVEAACGGRAEYYARYTGTKAKTRRLGFTKKATAALGKLGFANGKFLRVFWNPKARQLGLIISTKGFKLRAGRDSLAIAGAGLVPVLGAEPIEFVEMPPVTGYDLVLSATGKHTR